MTQKLVNAIIDAELDSAKFANDAYESASGPAKKLSLLARKLVKLTKDGTLKQEDAKRLWQQTFRDLVVANVTKQINGVHETMDKHLTTQIEEAKKLGKEVKKIPAIRNDHIKQRANERAGAVKDGVLKTNGA